MQYLLCPCVRVIAYTERLLLCAVQFVLRSVYSKVLWFKSQHIRSYGGICKSNVEVDSAQLPSNRNSRLVNSIVRSMYTMKEITSQTD